MSRKDDMRSTLNAIRSNPAGKDGKHTAEQITAMANLERGIANIERWEAKNPHTMTVHTREKLMKAVDDPNLSDKKRERAKEMLARDNPRYSDRERRDFGL